MPTDYSSRYPDALAALKRVWGYDAFRTGQDKAVMSVLRGTDTLVLFPTGGGKSLCYQVPALVLDGLTLVVSPLVALMEDQVNQLRRNGVAAEFINSTISRSEVEQRVLNARNGMYRLLYVAPERLNTPLFQYELASLSVELVAIDEAHCISEWGHEFRPSYRQIRPWIEAAGVQPRWLALTATATPRVRDDMVANLGFKDPVVVTKTFERTNLRWWVMPTSQKMTTLQRLLSKTTGSGLIYAGTRRECEQLAGQISAMGIPAAAYHAGLPSEKRKKVQEDWIHDRTPLVVATNAFGMGIDKSDCRFVIHWSTPGSLEAYYQEAGRAGRDGRPSFPVLLWSPSDMDRLRRHTDQSHPDRDTLHKVYSALCDHLDLALGTMHDEAHAVDPAALAKRADVPVKMISHVLSALEKHGVISLTVDYKDSLGVRFLGQQEHVSHATNGRNAAKDRFGDQLVRLYGAEAMETLHFLELDMVCEKMGLSRNAMLKGLEVFRHDGLLEYELRDGKPLIQLAEPRQPRVPVGREAVERYRSQLLTKLEFMEGYATTGQCRSRYLRHYFGEDEVPENCGNCDICLKASSSDDATDPAADARSVAAVLQKGPLDVTEMRRELGWKADRLRRCLDWLSGEGWVAQDQLNPARVIWTKR